MTIYDNYDYGKLQANDFNIVRIGKFSLTPAGIETPGGTLVTWSDLQDDLKVVKYRLTFSRSQLGIINTYIAEHALADSFKIIMFDGLSNRSYTMTDSSVIETWAATMDSHKMCLLDYIYDLHCFGEEQVPCLAFIPSDMTDRLRYSREIRKGSKRGSRGRKKRKPSNITR
jgi:hypothetical protein